MNDLIKIFKALSDKNRLRIVKMLHERELCVCEITEVLNLAVSTVSKHLAILKDANIISDRKDGRWVNYKINNRANIDLKNILQIVSRNLTNHELIQIDLNKVIKADREELCQIQ